MLKMLKKSCIYGSVLMAVATSMSTLAFADTQTYMNSGTTSDQELAKTIRDKISSGWFSKGYDQVKVEVNNGNVSLTGSVNSSDDKEKLDKEIRNISGVKSLNSQVMVQNSSNDNRQSDKFADDTYGTGADEQLNKKIRDNVSRGWLWDSYKNIKLKTINGDVTLEGTVDSLSDQQKLVNEIQKIDGVKSVKSNLIIKNNK